MSKIILQGHIIVPDIALSSVEAELPTHIELTLQEEGCLVFQVTQDLENNNVFNVYEEFIDRDAFEAHKKRVKESRWGKVTVNVERYYQVSEED